jgi:hypothetical protein
MESAKRNLTLAVITDMVIQRRKKAKTMPKLKTKPNHVDPEFDTLRETVKMQETLIGDLDDKDIFDVTLDPVDHNACPRCGGDLEDGDHNFCQKW